VIISGRRRWRGLNPGISLPDTYKFMTAAERRPPMSEYLLFEATPTRMITYTRSSQVPEISPEARRCVSR